VLHDMFGVSFDEIGAIVGRSPAAARQLASRARRRVQGQPTTPDADLPRQRQIVEAFLSASRGGDFDALVAVLDPDVVLHPDTRRTATLGRAGTRRTGTPGARRATPGVRLHRHGAGWRPPRPAPRCR